MSRGRRLFFRRAALAVWVVAILVSAAYVPQLRLRLGESASRGWRVYLALSLGLLSVAGLGLALARNRGRAGPTLFRLALLAAGGSLGLSLLANPDPRARFIEAAHLAEYGVLGVLAFLAIAASTLVLRLGRSFNLISAVGLIDESLQWALPARTAEIRDVALNALSGAIGLGYAVIVFGGSREMGPATEREIRSFLMAAAVLVLALGLFLQAVHRGHWIRWSQVEFVSMFRESELERMGDDRRARWANLSQAERSDLLHPERCIWGVEDFYATEALRHIQARNDAAERGDARAAAAENRLLELWYAPFLSATGTRVPFEPDLSAGTYRSPALRHLWPWLTPLRLWGATLPVAGALAGLAFRAAGGGGRG